MTREEIIHELGEWLEQMVQHGVPSHSAKRKALATAIVLLSAEAADVYKAHEEEHLEIINRIKELQYAIAKTQTIVGKVVESAETHEIRTETHGVCSDLINRADVLEGLKHSTAYLHNDIYTIVNRIPSAEATGALDEAITKYVADGYMLPPSGDYISRADALRELNGACSNWKDDCKVAEIINALPSSDAVQGEWKPFDTTWGRSIYYCSVCEESTYVPTEMGNPIYNYCPLCGSYMRKKGGAE